MQTIEDRLAALERGMWRWKIVSGVLAVGIVGAYLLGAGPSPVPQRQGGNQQGSAAAPPTAPAITDTIQAKHFEVLNDAGHVMARLESTDAGARIQFFSSAGKVIAEGGSSTDGGSQFAAYDDGDNPANMARISVAREQADVVAEDKHGKAQLSTGTAPGEAGETPRGISILEHGRVIWQTRGDRR